MRLVRIEGVRGSNPLSSTGFWRPTLAESASRVACLVSWGCNPQAPPGGFAPGPRPRALPPDPRLGLPVHRPGSRLFRSVGWFLPCGRFRRPCARSGGTCSRKARAGSPVLFPGGAAPRFRPGAPPGALPGGLAPGPPSGLACSGERAGFLLCSLLAAHARGGRGATLAENSPVNRSIRQGCRIEQHALARSATAAY